MSFKIKYYIRKYTKKSPAGVLKWLSKKIALLTLFFAYLLCLLLIGELVLRKFFPTNDIVFSRTPPLSFKLSDNKNIGYELRPNIMDNNSDGLRDREYEITKKPNVTRIIIIGDSIAYGAGVLREETYSTELEQILNKESKNNKTYEVLNLGVPGYGTVQIYNHFMYKGLKYDPDIVIYGYCFNDYNKLYCSDTLYPFFADTRAALWEAYARLSARMPITDKSRELLLHSETFKRIVYCYFSLKRDKIRQEMNHNTFSKNISGTRNISSLYHDLGQAVDKGITESKGFLFGLPLKHKDFHDYINALDNLNSFCRKKSIRFVLLVTPIFSDFKDYKYISLHNYIRNVTETLHIETFDTLENFSEQDKSCKLKPNDLLHPNPTGHKLIANSLADYLQEIGELYTNKK